MRGKTVIKICKHCNKDFTALQIKDRQGKAIYCSIECYKQYRDINKQDEKLLNRLYQKKNKYGLTKEEYLQLFIDQQNKCKICSTEFDGNIKAFVDHDHISGKVRGLLCTRCNSLLGFAKDNIDILIKSIQYLNNIPS